MEVPVDLFTDDSLRNPFADYARIRDAGPVVRLARPEVYALGRFADVQAALRSSNVLLSGKGVGFSEAFNSSSDGMSLIQSDGKFHSKLRLSVMRPLVPAKLRQARADLKAMIARRVAALANGGEFDAISELASFLPVQAISHLVGLPSVGRERMLEWAAANFNVIGPDQDAADLQKLAEARAFIFGLDEGSIRDGSWAGELFAQVRLGHLSRDEALAAISAYVIPSLDTTILAKGHLLYNLAVNPDQWDLLKEFPSLIPSAVLEGVRRDSVLRWFSRMAAEDYTVDGLVVPKGARVMLLYGCANRDERKYEDPDRFNVRRNPRDHLAWGTGAHMCVGLHLAQLEMEVLLEALVEADSTLHAGAPTLGCNRGLFGFTQLPYRIQTSARQVKKRIQG